MIKLDVIGACSSGLQPYCLAHHKRDGLGLSLPENFRGGRATTVLDRLSSSANPLWLREKASFWLGAERGRNGYVALKKLASDPDPEFRKKLSFDLFVSHDPAAVDDLTDIS